MTEQTPADLADKVRKLAARFRQQMEPHTPAAECSVWECAAEAVETLLSPPPRPTLADIPPEERAACAWMQADLADGGRMILDQNGGSDGVPADRVTPRFDLPRLAWPTDEGDTDD